jgi:CheY-like chemotaxis protein
MEPAAAGTPQRVLVVDDNMDAAKTLGMVLDLVGHKTRIAHDGTTALQLAAEFEPQVVLLDIGLPEMDGYAVARELRKQRAMANVLLVALTGYGQEDDRRRSQEAGFDIHMIKPVEPEALCELLATSRPGRK